MKLEIRKDSSENTYLESEELRVDFTKFNSIDINHLARLFQKAEELLEIVGKRPWNTDEAALVDYIRNGENDTVEVKCEGKTVRISRKSAEALNLVE